MGLTTSPAHYCMAYASARVARSGLPLQRLLVVNWWPPPAIVCAGRLQFWRADCLCSLVHWDSVPAAIVEGMLCRQHVRMQQEIVRF